MSEQCKSVNINGTEYVRKDLASQAKDATGMQYCIFRCPAGIFAGYLHRLDGANATIFNSRRLWYWTGAASLSQLANEGTKKPNECKFPAPVAATDIFGIIEIIYCTEAARQSIEGVKVWQQ